MVRRSIAAAVLVLASAGLARAQITPIDKGIPSGADMPSLGAWAPYEHSPTPEEAGRDYEIERRYRETLARIPNKKPSNDPWKSIRPATTAVADRHRPQ